MKSQLEISRNPSHSDDDRQNFWLTPWRDINSGLNSIQNMFERWSREMSSPFSSIFGGSGRTLTTFNPSSEITEDKNNYYLKFDLPGVAKEDIKLEITQNTLHVSADRKQEKREDSSRRHFSEISYGFYERTFTLPQSISEDNIRAQFENGVLTVTVPKQEPSSSKSIDVA